jgi:protease-4
MNPEDNTAPAATPAEAAAAIPPAPAPATPAAPSAFEQTMALFARDYLADRRAERRWRVFFRMSWLIVFALLLWMALSARTSSTAPSAPHTALVEVRGEIAADTEASAELLVAALKNAFQDEGAQAVVLRFNSPGGSPVQAGIVNDEIRRLKALYKKKVYAVIEEECARARTTSRWRPTRSLPTRPASSARSAC